MHPICTEQDPYIRELIRSVKLTWKITLTDGTVVWGDPDRYAVEIEVDDLGGGRRLQKDEPEALKPWNRLKKHCWNNDVYVTKVQVIVMGAPEEIIWEDSDGVDGIFVKRGFAGTQDMETGDTQAFQNLIVGVVDDDCEEIQVRKYSWPFNVLEPFEQTRKPTLENVDQMLFKRGSMKPAILAEKLGCGVTLPDGDVVWGRDGQKTD